MLALTRTRAGGWRGTRKPGLISGTGGLEAGWSLTMLYHTDLPKSSLGTTLHLGGGASPPIQIVERVCLLFGLLIHHRVAACSIPSLLSLCEFIAILGPLRTQWFSQRTREPVDIFSAILPLLQIHTLQFLSPSGFFCQPFSSLNAEHSAPPGHISVCPLLPLLSPAGRVPIWVRK